MSKFTDFFPGSLIPKFQEFNSSGTFTPTEELIDSGGYIEVLLVAGGSCGGTPGGGEALTERMYLTSVNGCSVTIGAGGALSGSNGSNSSFNGASAGGSSITSSGGTQGSSTQSDKISAGWGGAGAIGGNSNSAGTGVYGYGAGGGTAAGVANAKVNSGQGASSAPGGSGYCLIKWYE
jgi:hypothetical protein